MKKVKKVEPKLIVDEAPPAIRSREFPPLIDSRRPDTDSWTYRNYGPGGYIDAHGVPCRPDWY